MEVEVVVCSSSGKPIYHYKKPADAVLFTPIQEESTHSFVSSLQGLLSFVNCMQHDDLQEIETDGCMCVFHTVEDILSYAVIVREPLATSVNSLASPRRPAPSHDCLERLLRLLHSQIVFVLSDRGLDVLRKQPGYDLRDLLIGTERVVCGLTSKWLSDPVFRFKDFGLPFLRLDPEDRVEITQTIEYNPTQSPEARGMICGVLLAAGKVVAIAQPMRKQFSVLVDDLLLLINFIYETPSFTKSETWMPVCLPAFNASGFLHAYVAFLAPDIALVMLSTQQSPEQFHYFQAKRTFIEQNLKESGAISRIVESVTNHVSWRPHRDLPLLHHFIFKNELTGECASPLLDFPFSEDDAGIVQLVDHYARLQHGLHPPSHRLGLDSQVLGKRLPSLQSRIGARVVMHRTNSALYMGLCTEDHRLFVWFDALACGATRISDAALQEQCQVLLDRLKRDEELMSVSLFGGSLGASLWP